MAAPDAPALDSTASSPASTGQRRRLMKRQGKRFSESCRRKKSLANMISEFLPSKYVSRSGFRGSSAGTNRTSAYKFVAICTLTEPRFWERLGLVPNPEQVRPGFSFLLRDFKEYIAITLILPYIFWVTCSTRRVRRTERREKVK